MNITQLEKLDKLAQLKKQGVLTQEEFRQEKQKILNDKSIEKTTKSDKCKNVSDFWVWVLALSPLFIDFIVVCVCDLFGLEYSFTTYFWVGVGFYSLLCYIDTLAVAKVEPDHDLDLIWVFLVPIYLYKRSKIFGNYTYFWVWIICCFISVIIEI